MLNLLRRTLYTIIGIIITFAILTAVLIPILTRRSFPQSAGEIRLPGLDAPVDIYRDSFGVPHIYANTQHDLFFCQWLRSRTRSFLANGFMAASGAGRLSELLGKNTVEIDTYIQTLGWERVVRAELAMLDPELKAILQAYTDGVNVYLVEHKGSDSAWNMYS